MNLSVYTIEETALERDTEGCIVGRRDLLIGYWAGRQLGLAGPALDRYAKSVIVTDSGHPGGESVVRMVAEDLERHGIHVSPADIHRRLRDAQQQAYSQFLATD